MGGLEQAVGLVELTLEPVVLRQVLVIQGPELAFAVLHLGVDHGAHHRPGRRRVAVALDPLTKGPGARPPAGAHRSQVGQGGLAVRVPGHHAGPPTLVPGVHRPELGLQPGLLRHRPVGRLRPPADGCPAWPGRGWLPSPSVDASLLASRAR